MENTILKRGDFVRVKEDKMVVGVMHLTKGSIYEIVELGKSGLGILHLCPNVGVTQLFLVHDDGTLSDLCEYVTFHRCPVTMLSRGQGVG